MENPRRYLFSPGIGEEDIIRIEKITGLKLPNSYRIFLTHYNGGYILPNTVSGKCLSQEQLEDYRWNSLVIFSLEELYQKYQNLSEQKWKLGYDWEGVYPIIPCCHTRDQEILIFIQPLDSSNESPVFDAFHEDFPSSWGQLYPDFSTFLEEFLDSDGNLSTIASGDEPSVSSLLPDKAWKAIPEDDLNYRDLLSFYQDKLRLKPDDVYTLQELAEAYRLQHDLASARFYLNKAVKISPENAILLYTESKLQADEKNYSEALRTIEKAIDLMPDVSLYYLARAEYFTALKDTRAALESYNLALEKDPSFSYALYCRGKLQKQLHNLPKALRDLENAVLCEPGCSLYLTLLAEIQLKLERVPEALKSCDIAIENDPDYVNPYIIRERIYRLMGRYNEAESDKIKIGILLDILPDFDDTII